MREAVAPRAPGLDAAVHDAIAYVERSRERIVRELQALVRFPSVSADRRHDADLRACAAWLAEHLRGIGLSDVAILPTARHPVVRATWRGAPVSSTALIYGHYDVVPAEPLDQWRSPPFQPTLRGDSLRGRGTSDDKGQLFAHVKAVEAWLRTAGALPVNVVLLLEGEEEIGSPSLSGLLAHHRHAFPASVAVVSDTPMLGLGRPALTYALRGALTLDVQVVAAHRELHSGTFGGAVTDPAHVLCDVIASLRDAWGRVGVDGFYDRVRPVTRVERARLARAGPTADWRREAAATAMDRGEPEYSAFERAILRPALTVQRLTAGYTGPGQKAVVPAHAIATLGIRLVPDQDPDEITSRMAAHVRRVAPPSIRVAVTRHLSAPPYVLDRQPPGLPAALAAYRGAFGTSAGFVRAGGTIPAVPMLGESLGVPPLLMGFALPDDGAHGPNERLHLPTFWRAIETSIRLLAELGRAEEPSDDHRRTLPRW